MRLSKIIIYRMRGTMLRLSIKIWLPLSGILLILAIFNCSDDNKAVPTLSTPNVTIITQTTVKCGGTVVDSGKTAVNTRGVCWSTNAKPTITDNITKDGAELGTFSRFITGLTANTTYFIRAYATNNDGTGYGNEVSFTTLAELPGTVTDIEGNVYQTVKIGEQVWMRENLKVTHYKNGDPILNAPDNKPYLGNPSPGSSKLLNGQKGNVKWSDLTYGAYCNYRNNEINVATYGRLYNWFAVDDSRCIAPDGWHVPTDEEWKQLEVYLGMRQSETNKSDYRGHNEGAKLKDTGNTHWDCSNDDATNESAFTALPGGCRFPYGGFFLIGNDAAFWASTEVDKNEAWTRRLKCSSSEINRNAVNKQSGFSVRCIKD